VFDGVDFGDAKTPELVDQDIRARDRTACSRSFHRGPR
jgi:hypothetical protein